MDIIEELKEERLARKKAYEIEERLKKIKKVKRKKYRGVAFIVLAVVLVWAGIVGFSFWENYKNSTLRDAEPELQTTQEPQKTEKPKDTADDSYTVVTIDGIEIAYPDKFTQSEVGDMDCVASFSDEDGDAMLIIDRKAATQTPIELMDEYCISVLNGVPDEGKSKASDKGYVITLTAGTKKRHKKCIIKDGEAISYELIYHKDDMAEYEGYAEYMDENFTVS